MPAVLSDENGKTLSLRQLKPQGIELSLLGVQWRARYDRAVKRCCGVFHTWWGENTDRALDLANEIQGFFIAGGSYPNQLEIGYQQPSN